MTLSESICSYYAVNGQSSRLVAVVSIIPDTVRETGRIIHNSAPFHQFFVLFENPATLLYLVYAIRAYIYYFGFPIA